MAVGGDVLSSGLQRGPAASPRPAPYSHASPPRRKRAMEPEIIDLTKDTPPRKRKREMTEGYSYQEPVEKVLPESPRKRRTGEEKRRRRFRKAAPTSFQEVQARALTQRMFVLDRQRFDGIDHPIEEVSMAGTTGNVYTITIDKEPTCNCPHALKGNQCKHIVYVMARVLRAPTHLQYQLALLSAELMEIFAHAPPLPSQQGDETVKDGNRKPLEGECPICCVDFEPDNGGEEIVYCKAACGNNIHRGCFEQWAATKRNAVVTCPFCRAAWEGDEEITKKLSKSGPVNTEGYVNVASQLGLSGRRDYSTYNDFWVRQRTRHGDIDWDADDAGYVGPGY